ncbi:MAG TPA: hypothetical protein PLI53_05345 [Geobacteraceae bacterium]|nr:hypothetical protein [Geobacteraceae bacterium]
MVTIKPENKPVTFRRLLLAKELYLHALEHSTKVGDINKIIAVHNFHNAIEIALKAIVLNYGIRGEKQLNIDFETLLNQIDNYQAFKEQEQRLPYRQEVRNLNQIRNLVQHHGIEPESSTMEDWRVFSKNFLVRIYDEYFGCDFNKISLATLINDCRLRQLLELASDKISSELWLEATAISKIAFLWGANNIYQALPTTGFKNKAYATSNIRPKRGDGTRGIAEAIEMLFDRIENAEYFTAFLSSGISLLDYKKFEAFTPIVQFMGGGKHTIIATKEFDERHAQWVHEFVINTIVKWQVNGLNPEVPEWAIEGFESILNKYTSSH